MALFSSRNKKISEKLPKVEAKIKINPVALGSITSTLSIRPRITEKATMKSENGVYTFNVPISAGKRAIADSIRALFKVTPVKVRVVKVQRKKLMSKGRHGSTALGKKAYVYLKKGDVIEFV